MMTPHIPVISDAHYDGVNNRVVITVEPCEGADRFSVTRCNNPQLLWGEWVGGAHIVDATGEPQTFFDYLCPLNSQVRYRVLSYAVRADGLLLASRDYSAPVMVDTTDLNWYRKAS